MNKLTQQEFQDRIEAVARARHIFINSGVAGGNITTAFTLYQEVLAEQDRAVIIETLTSGHRPPAPFDIFERPKCPECGTDMMFLPLRDNDEGHKTMLSCSNSQCPIVLYSDHDLNWWAEELRNANRPEQTETGE